jgi:hypothetical protein
MAGHAVGRAVVIRAADLKSIVAGPYGSDAAGGRGVTGGDNDHNQPEPA